ncbi:MAG: insulinase family protein, partial [Acidobacteriota bacterium]
IRGELEDRVQLPRIYYGWHIPPYGDEAWYAADLLTSVLTEGRSSPLVRDLVTKRQMARDVSAYVYPTEATGMLYLQATCSPDVAIEDLEAAIDEHLDGVMRQPPKADHLARAKNRVLTGHYNALQSLERRSDMLARCATYLGDPGRAETEAEVYDRLDAEAVWRTAALLRPDARVALRVVPKREEAA